MIQQNRMNRSLSQTLIQSLAVIATCTWMLAGAPALSIAGDKFDSNSLPESVADMRNAILDAADTANLEEMRVPIELNEIKPLISGSAEGDPVALLRQLSPDTGGIAVLAVLLDILALPAARSDDGQTFTWPYLATMDLSNAEPKVQLDLHRLLSVDDTRKAIASGKYPGLYLEIGADGTWHSFGTGE